MAVIESAASVAKALCGSGLPASLSLIAPECNSFGLALLGARTVDGAQAAAGKDSTIIVLENDLYQRMPAKKANAFLESAARVIVLDHLVNATTAKASLLLPAATIAESDGTLVSSEGRAQRFFSVFPHRPDIRDSWRWLRQPRWASLDDVLADLTKESHQLAGIVGAAPLSMFREAGAKIPREPRRASGRTAMTANLTVVEPKPPEDPDSSLSYTMEGAPLQPPGALQPFFWSPGWNSIQSVNKFQSEIGSALRTGDPGVRLIEPSGRGEYFTAVPSAFVRRNREWLVIPIEHIFGSEELSGHAPAIAKLAFEPYIALSAADAESLGVKDGAGEVEIELGGKRCRLRVKVAPNLPAGIAGIPDGLPPAFGEVLPAWRRIEGVR